MPVLISGAGPTGLYLALCLAKNGVPVRIVEKALDFHDCSRGASLQPRTLEFQRILGLEDRLLNWGGGTTMPALAVYKMPGGVEVATLTRLLEERAPTPSNPYGNVRLVPQAIHERILRDVLLREYGVVVEKGKELVGFTQDDNGITATITVHDKDGKTNKEEIIRADYLCGADGAKGPVRKLMGCTFSGKIVDGGASVVADLIIHGLEEHWHMWKIPSGNITILSRPMLDGKPSFTTLIFGFSTSSLDAEDLLKPGAFVKFFNQAIGRSDLDVKEPYNISYYRPHIRRVDTFQNKRAFLLGDAAHVHTPAGGQGLNASVNDAVNLGWKLAAVYKKLASPSLLETFTEERLPVIAHMLGENTDLYNKIRDVKSKQPDGSAKPESFYSAFALSQLGVNYRWSSIVHDGRARAEEEIKDDRKAFAYGGYDDELRAGDRAPDAPGLTTMDSLVSKNTPKSTRLFDVFDPAKHTVLLFVRSSGDIDTSTLRSTADGIPPETIQIVLIAPVTISIPLTTDKAFIDGAGHAYTSYQITEKDRLTFVVVRPDAYIGAIGHSADDLSHYFKQILGT